MARSGYVKLHYAALDSTLWSLKSDHLKVAMTSLLLANWKPGTLESGGELIQVPRGSFFGSWPSLARECRLTPKVTMGAVRRLERIEFMSRKRAGQGQLFSIVNFDTYQARHDDEGSLRAGGGQAAGSVRSGDGQCAGYAQGMPRSGDGIPIEEGKKGRREEVCVDAARTAADRVWQLALDAHLAVKRELGVDAPAPALMGPGKSELIARITELAGSANELGERRGIPGAERILAHVVSVLAAEAVAKRDLRSLRPSTAFSPKVVDWAMAQTTPGQSGAQRALAMLSGGTR